MKDQALQRLKSPSQNRVKSASAAAVHARCRRKSRPCRLFQFSQRYANVRIVGPEQAILHFLYIVERVHKIRGSRRSAPAFPSCGRKETESRCTGKEAPQ